jgi:hypothetical protein
MSKTKALRKKNCEIYMTNNNNNKRIIHNYIEKTREDEPNY